MTACLGEIRVLVVGPGTLTLTDDPQVLRSYGLDIGLQTDPLAALVGMRESRPDAVVLPLRLQSVQVASLIHTITGALKVRCHIVWAPEVDAEEIERCLDAGACGLLPPRLSARELAQALSVSATPRAGAVVRAGPIALDLDGFTVRNGTARAELSPALTTLLKALVIAHPEPVNQVDLVELLGLRSTVTLASDHHPTAQAAPRGRVDRQPRRTHQQRSIPARAHGSGSPRGTSTCSTGSRTSSMMWTPVACDARQRARPAAGTGRLRS